jgi:cytochrome b561
MLWRDTKQSYGAPSLLLHWFAAFAIAAAWLVGTVMGDLPRGAPRATGIDLHFALGTLVLTLTALRLLWRLSNPQPDSPPGTPRWQDRAAHFAHLGLYGLMFAVPLSGVIAAWLGGKAVNLFWITTLASPWTRNRAWEKAAEEVHEWLANGLLFLVAAHVAAALWHHFVRRDSVLRRMLPFAGDRRTP